MGPWYRSLTTAASGSASASTSTSGSLLDAKLLSELESANEQELKRLDERLADAEKTEGEMEISDALKAKANYLTRIGDKVSRSLFISLLYYSSILTFVSWRCIPFISWGHLIANLMQYRTKPSPHKSSHSKRRQAWAPVSTSSLPSSGLASSLATPISLPSIWRRQKSTSRFSLVAHLVITLLARRLIDEGGDWDRRNRLKVYNALHLISTPLSPLLTHLFMRFHLPTQMLMQMLKSQR